MSRKTMSGISESIRNFFSGNDINDRDSSSDSSDNDDFSDDDEDYLCKHNHREMIESAVSRFNFSPPSDENEIDLFVKFYRVDCYTGDIIDVNNNIERLINSKIKLVTGRSSNIWLSTKIDLPSLDFPSSSDRFPKIHVTLYGDITQEELDRVNGELRELFRFGNITIPYTVKRGRIISAPS